MWGRFSKPNWSSYGRYLGCLETKYNKKTYVAIYTSISGLNTIPATVQAETFEFSPSETLLIVGTLDKQIVIVNLHSLTSTNYRLEDCGVMTSAIWSKDEAFIGVHC